MKTLYFDCFAGAAGDMILGALISLGVGEQELRDGLKKLRLDELSLELSKVDRAGISATRVEVGAPAGTKHRHLRHIEDIINGSDLSENAKERAAAIFRRLAEAEAQVHGVGIEKVHFHEVGAIDAIADVVGACIGFELLGIENFACSRINVGNGFVKMSHGIYPVPPPAVVNLLKGIPVYAAHAEGELFTPTAAAIISTVCSSYGPLPQLTIEASGYGAGSREYDGFPNVLRLIVGETVSAPVGISKDALNLNVEMDELLLLETNIDDCSPQIVGFALERALEIGALDSWATPVQMKKGRPGMKLSILCPVELGPNLTEMLFRETTTLGVRATTVQRTSLQRTLESVNTRFGTIDVKVARSGPEVVNAMPEYEQVKRAALEHNVPFRELQETVMEEFEASGSKLAG